VLFTVRKNRHSNGNDEQLLITRAKLRDAQQDPRKLRDEEEKSFEEAIYPTNRYLRRTNVTSCDFVKISNKLKKAKAKISSSQ